MDGSSPLFAGKFRAAGGIVIFGLALAIVSVAAPSLASETVIDIDLTNDSFQPAEVQAPFGFPFTLRFHNKTKVAAEVESSGMRFEKLVGAGRDVVVKVRPIDAGSYEFYNDFKPKVRGHVVVGE